MKNWFLVLVALLSACSSENQGQGRKRPPMPVRTLQVSRQTFVRSLQLTGEVVAPLTVSLSANVEGNIACCFWREGETLEKGQQVFEINRELYDREVDIAKNAWYLATARHRDQQAGFRPEEINRMEQDVIAERKRVEFLQKDLDRVTSLYETKNVSKEALEKAELELTAARARLTAAENQLAIGKKGATDTQLAVTRMAEGEARARLQAAHSRKSESRIEAPFSGTITRVFVRPGDNASPRAPLLEMADLNDLVVRFSVPERQSSFMQPKLVVRFRFDAHPDRELSGKVERIHPVLDPKSRVLRVEASVEEPVKLIPGMFARVRLILEEIPDQIVVPQSAVFTQGEKHFVFAVEDGKTRRIEISIGHSAERLVQVLGGLSGDERIIAENADQFRDNQPVMVVQPGHSGRGANNSGKDGDNTDMNAPMKPGMKSGMKE